jgi:hypothetical protein
MEEIVTDAEVALANALNDQTILDALTLYGYNAEKINTGKTLAEECSSLMSSQKLEYAEQKGATAEFQDKLEAADTAYMKSLRVARIAFKNDADAIEALALNGERKGTYSGWITQVEAFYDNLLANDEWMTVMGNFGYTPEKVQGEKALVDDVVQANITQEEEKGEAQKATQERDRKIDELNEWMSDFREIASVALDDDNQLLEKLGILVRS